MKERREIIVALKDAIKYLKDEGELAEQVAILSRLVNALADLDHGVVSSTLTPIKPWQARKQETSDPALLRVACAALVKAKMENEQMTASEACLEVATLVGKLGFNGAGGGEVSLKDEIEGWQAKFEYEDGPSLDDATDETKGIWKNFCGLIQREPSFAISQLERLIKDHAPRRF